MIYKVKKTDCCSFGKKVTRQTHQTKPQERFSGSLIESQGSISLITSYNVVVPLLGTFFFIAIAAHIASIIPNFIIIQKISLHIVPGWLRPEKDSSR